MTYFGSINFQWEKIRKLNLQQPVFNWIRIRGKKRGNSIKLNMKINAWSKTKFFSNWHTAPPLTKREESADLKTIFKISKYFFKFEVNDELWRLVEEVHIDLWTLLCQKMIKQVKSSCSFNKIVQNRLWTLGEPSKREFFGIWTTKSWRL